MKKKLSKMLAVLLGVLMLAVCVPAAAFADDADATASEEITVNLHVWMPADDYMDYVTVVTNGIWEMNEPRGNSAECKKVVESFTVKAGESFTLPTTISGAEVKGGWFGGWFEGIVLYGAGKTLSTTELRNVKDDVADFWALAPDLYPAPVRDAFNAYDDRLKNIGLKKTNTTTTESAPVDTRTAQQKEIDEMIANGTWEEGYTTCKACGYHNWTRQGNVYVCDNCGNTVTEVVSAKNVKGYVGSGAIAPVAAAEDTTPKYATAQEAQAAADKREAAYAAAVAAFQKQIAAQNAAYLAALGK